MSIWRKWQTETGGLFEINMTPLIDVSLTLVCILLLSSPLAFESGITVKKSARTAAEAEKKLSEERVEIFVVSEDSVVVNGAVVARRELRRALLPLIVATEEKIVVVGCDDTVSHGAFVDVLDHAKICGALDIAVVGR